LSNALPPEDLADLYDNAPCGYVSLLPDGRIAKLNRTLADWLGRVPEDLPGQRFSDCLGFGGRIAFETHLAPMLRLHGEVSEIALELLGASGAKIPVIANAREKRSENGSHLFTRITLFKAIDRRLYERSLVEARAAAEAAIAQEHETAMLREQFIAVLGHDLRNPLAALGAGAHLLAREQISERGKAVLKEMGQSVARASSLIDNVLDFARGRLGEGLILNRNSDEPLTPVLEQVVSEVRAFAPGREIRARFAIREPVHCDRQRIGQLAANLISNAVAHGSPDQPVQVEAHSTGDLFVFTVANAGKQIPAKARAQLFRPFFRGEVRRSQQGLGLGLFIVSEIAKAHGGTMHVHSGRRLTRFQFTMPQPPREQD
jgi:sigma-B regulation protein RsbU (phosphoserine phosphatase)